MDGEIFEIKETKSYFVPRYFQTQWYQTKSICAAYGLEIVSFDSLEEVQNILQLCKQNTNLLNGQTHVGGMTLEGKSLDKWYWVETGKRIGFSLPFAANEPNFDGGNEYCLSLSRDINHNFAFNDINCSGSDETKFICQKRENPF